MDAALTPDEQHSTEADRYYTKLGLACDALLRCKDCRRLVTHATIVERGGCPCGNRRVVEVTTLSTWEWIKIRLGVIQFPFRREFLREFETVAD